MTDKGILETDSHTRFFDASKELMPQLRPLVGLFVGMNSAVKVLAEKHNVDADLLIDWAIEQLPLRIVEESEGE